MIKLDLYTERENKFLEYLNYQISKRYSFYKKISIFHKQLDHLNLQIVSKESILKDSQRHFEEIRIREAYKAVIREYSDLIKNI